jgi:hypothetical protein
VPVGAKDLILTGANWRQPARWLVPTGANLCDGWCPVGANQH